jgi:excisionase family DNA binding protein
MPPALTVLALSVRQNLLAHPMSLSYWKILRKSAIYRCWIENFALSCRGLPQIGHHHMSTSTSEGEILTIKQVADYLKVTERTIYRLAAAKQIPAFKVGGSWRFSSADIDSWIRQQAMQARESTEK